jgi:hypothetical protein
LEAAPVECRDELNKTAKMYADLSGWKSPLALGISITFLTTESDVSHDDVNQALRECRKPESMATFAYASDLMKFFAGRVVELRNRRQKSEREQRERIEDERQRREHPERYRREVLATAEQISRLRAQFNGIGAMP